MNWGASLTHSANILLSTSFQDGFHLRVFILQFSKNCSAHSMLNRLEPLRRDCCMTALESDDDIITSNVTSARSEAARNEKGSLRNVVIRKVTHKSTKRAYLPRECHVRKKMSVHAGWWSLNDLFTFFSTFCATWLFWEDAGLLRVAVSESYAKVAAVFPEDRPRVWVVISWGNHSTALRAENLSLQGCEIAKWLQTMKALNFVWRQRDNNFYVYKELC